MRKYFTMKPSASVWSGSMSALVHHPDARTAWIVGLGLALITIAIVAWHYGSTTPLTSAQPQSSPTSLSINTLPAASLPALNADTQINADSAASSGNAAHTRVTVNDQSVSVPSNGTVHKQIKSDGATTHIDISSKTNTSGSSSSSSSLMVKVNTESDTESTTGSGP